MKNKGPDEPRNDRSTSQGLFWERYVPPLYAGSGLLTGAALPNVGKATFSLPSSWLIPVATCFFRILLTTVPYRLQGWARYFKKQHWKVYGRLYGLFLKISEIAQTWKARPRHTPGNSIQKSDKDTQASPPLSHLSILLDQIAGPQKIATPTEREGGSHVKPLSYQFKKTSRSTVAERTARG